MGIMYNQGILGSKYSEDEVLIFSGKMADKFTAGFLTNVNGRLKEIRGRDPSGKWAKAPPTQAILLDAERIRNAVADQMEIEMRSWEGLADVPIPDRLRWRMDAAAEERALIEITDILQLTPDEASFLLTSSPVVCNIK